MVVGLHKVDTCDTATVNLTQINVVLDGSTENEGLEAVLLAIIRLLLNEDSIVASYTQRVVCALALGPVLGLPVLVLVCAIDIYLQGSVFGRSDRYQG